MKLLILFISILLFSTLLHAKEKKDVLRAVVIERINQFITYSDRSIENEFKICIYKNEELSKTSSNLYKGRKYKGHDVKVVYIDKISDMRECNIFYAEDLSESGLKEVMLKKSKETLLVTNNEDTLYNGFMIAIFFEDNKIKFAVNQAAIYNAGLKVNYRLLQVASKVISRVRE